MKQQKTCSANQREHLSFHFTQLLQKRFVSLFLQKQTFQKWSRLPLQSFQDNGQCIKNGPLTCFRCLYSRRSHPSCVGVSICSKALQRYMERINQWAKDNEIQPGQVPGPAPIIPCSSMEWGQSGLRAAQKRLGSAG